MHCAACEILLEKELKRLSTVVSVKASTASNQIDVVYQHAKPDLDIVNQRINQHGYFLSEKPVTDDNKFISFDSQKGFGINGDNLFNFFYALVFAVLVLFIFRYLTGNAFGNFTVSQTSSFSAFFIFGVVAGLSTCAALVGGLLISLSKHWQNKYGGKVQPHVLFHAGRLVGYGLFGGLLGLIGSIIGISTIYSNSPITVVIISLVSMIIIFYGLELLGFGWAMKLLPKMPKRISHYIASDNNSRSGRFAPFLIGGLTFFLPCGFTVIAQGLALASGSIVGGALIMLFFAAGTIFPLSIISISGLSLSSKSQYSILFSYTLGLVLLFLSRS